MGGFQGGHPETEAAALEEVRGMVVPGAGRSEVGVLQGKAPEEEVSVILDPVPEEQGRVAKGKEEGKELELAEVLLGSDGPL